MNFDEDTSLLPGVVARTCLAHQEHSLTKEEAEWFIDHVDKRVRWSFANNFGWRRMLKSDRGLEQLYIWVNYWLDAYVEDPERYQERPDSIRLERRCNLTLKTVKKILTAVKGVQ